MQASVGPSTRCCSTCGRETSGPHLGAHDPLTPKSQSASQQKLYPRCHDSSPCTDIGRVAAPAPTGSPIFSAYHSDVIYYGRNLADYLEREFSTHDRRTPAADS